MNKFITTLTIATITLFGIFAGCKKKDNPREYRVASVVLDKQELRLGTEETATLLYTVKPDEAQNKQVQWSSSNPNIATVDQNGKVTTFTTFGRTTITVVSVEDSRRRDTCLVIVSNDVNGVRVTPDSITLLVGGGETQLAATVLPAKAINQKVSWKSTNPAVATVTENGRVRGVAFGETTIVVTTDEGNFTDTCRVIVDTTVPIRVTSVSLNVTSRTLDIGATETLIATVLPTDATIKTVSWRSSNETVATVNASGLVTARAAGSAVITVTTTDGNRTATCSLTVRTPSVTGVTLNHSDLGLTVNETETLTATVLPALANQNVSWSSNNTSVASVNSAGRITAHARGTAIITATTAEGNRTARCTITVRDLYVLTTTAVIKNGVRTPLLDTSGYTIDFGGMYKIGDDIFVTGHSSSGSTHRSRIWRNGTVVHTAENVLIRSICSSPSGNQLYAAGRRFFSGSFIASLFFMNTSGVITGFADLTTVANSVANGVSSPTNGIIYISGYDGSTGWVRTYDQREGGGTNTVWTGGTVANGMYASGSNWYVTGRSGTTVHLWRNGTAIPLGSGQGIRLGVASNGDVYVGGTSGQAPSSISNVWRIVGTTVTHHSGAGTAISVQDLKVAGNDVYAVCVLGNLFKNGRYVTGYSNVRGVVVE